MINPIKRIKNEKGLSTIDLATLANCSIAHVKQSQSGHVKTLPESILKALEKFGYDKKEIQKDYLTWKISEINKMLEDIV